ncbi:MAG: ABC transporter ATP-binding protein [Clostridiales bacterium]|nr:ABC transporter ATP-binding protein [Clostridiales bacterium]
MALLSLDSIDLIYQTEKSETEAVSNLSFTVDEGEFIALVGPSGCGKTTLLSMIAGLMKPTRGSVTIDGEPVSPSSGTVGYMLQRDNLFEWRTIEANVLLGLSVQKKLTDESRQYALGMLDKYGLGEFRSAYPQELSGGMRQRAALIRTLAFKPRLLLLDEPFSAVDFQTRMTVCDDVHSIIKNENKTALLVTHDISEAVSMADKVIVLTRRPATVKKIFTLDIDAPTPLKRRESPRFSEWFDRIWKEVSHD